MNEKVAAPATENAAPEKEEEQKKEAAPEKVTAVTTIPVEKIEDWKRKLTGSRDEALRLKAETERLAAEKAKVEAELNAFKTGQSQAYGYKPTTDEIRLFQDLARQAGVPLRSDLDAIEMKEIEKEKEKMVNQFIEKHPEYGQIGDSTSDALWEQLVEEVNLYQQPKDPRGYYKLMEKAHKQLTYDDGGMLERGKALGMAQATLKDQATLGATGTATAKMAPVKKGVKEDIERGFAQVRPEAFA